MEQGRSRARLVLLRAPSGSLVFKKVITAKDRKAHEGGNPGDQMVTVFHAAREEAS